MNNETSLLIAIGLVLFVIVLLFGFTQATFNESKKSILGEDGSEGIVDCDPTGDTGSDCPGQLPAGDTEESSWKPQEKEKAVIQL